MAISSVNPFANGRTAGHMPVFGKNFPPQPATPKNDTEKTAGSTKIRNFDDRTAGMTHMNASAKPGEFSFFDLLDIINPLQHIPIVSSFYRNITGDEIKPAARAIGGFLFGGPLGLAAGIVNGAVADATGKDLPETLLTSVSPPQKTAVPSHLSGETAFLAQHYSQEPHNRV
ncbi:MAG: hypothetical protein EP349_02265 [Alphaproteobacteria bacterium]|nr:MAG: hypothetical protein EP349_02265 [Alphaproteobacteria bacterium]